MIQYSVEKQVILKIVYIQNKRFDIQSERIYKYIINMIEILLTIIILITVSIVYITASSYRFKKFYAKSAAQYGYKVYEHPYCFLGSRMYTQFKIQEQLHNDAHYHYKNQLSRYDIIVSNLVFKTMVELESPELIKQFFMKANEGYYVKSQVGFGHLQRLIGKQNLLLAQGDSWKNRRRILSAVFNFDFIVSQIPKIQQITRNVLDKLQSKQGTQQKQINCNITEPLNQVFSTVILKCFFKGETIFKIGEYRTIDYINKMLLKISNIGRSKIGVVLGIKFAKLGLTPTNKEINQEISFFRKIVKQIVIKRIKEIQEEQKGNINNNKSPEDIIQALIRNNQVNLDESKSDNKNVDEEQKKNKNKEIITIDSIINEFVTFFLAGSQTTLAFTRMMIYRLASHPQILQKVRQQFQKEIKTDTITNEQLKNLKYFQKVQRQVLRMDSSVGAVFTRIATKDHYLGNLKIYKGMAVNVRLKGTHFKQSQYISPREFNPERWDQKNIKNNYSYIPFSGGARICIGLHLALLQNKIFMIEFLRRYKDIKIPKKDQDLVMKITTLYGPQKITTTLIKNI